MVGEAGVRFIRTTRRRRADKLLYQAKLALDDDLRLKSNRKMRELRFRDALPPVVPLSNCAVLKRLVRATH